MKLYDLIDGYQALLAAAEDTDDLDSLMPLLEQANAASNDVTSKVDSIASLVRSFELSAAAAKQEKDRLETRQAHYDRRAAWLKSYLQGALVVMGADRVTGPRFTVSLRKCQPSVFVIDDAAVPAEFTRTRTETSVDKAGILAQWKKDQSVPQGVRIVDDKKSLSIR